MFLRTYQSRLFFFAFLLLVFLIATQFYSYINTEQVVLQEAERSLERTAQLFNAHLIAERQELKRFVTFVRDDNRIQEYVFIITKFDSGREELSKKYKKLYGWLPTDRTLILGSIDQIIYGDKNVDLLKVLSKYKNSIKIHSFYFHGHQGLELVTIAPIFHKGNIIGRIVLTRILNNQWLQGKRKTGVGHVLIEKDNVILRSTFENLQSKEFNPSDSRLIIEGNVFRLYSIDLEGTDSYSPHLWFATSETAVLNQLKEQLNKALYK